MKIFKENNNELAIIPQRVDSIISSVSGYAKESEIKDLEKLKENFSLKINDFYRENRKLNIGVVGQVKAGKSSFLNTLLFNGKTVLPKASTPKTATLTKMEYAEENMIQIEYYSEDEWEIFEDNATVDLEDEIYTTARELVEMVSVNGFDPHPYLEKGMDEIRFDTYEDLIAHLNDYVGEDGKYTPIVKSVTLYLHNDAFKGISIVDTPGLNDPIVSRTIRTKEFIEVCDVVFFLSQSSSFLDKSDWILLSSQLPQKGVKRLVLIASKYDSGIRDILRIKDENDIFEDENTTDSIPQACKMIKKKFRKRTKGKVQEFIRDLEYRGSSPELIKVISQCSEPIMVSALACNMVNKPENEYSGEERNLYDALNVFTDNIQSDLALIGNIDEVKQLFNEVVQEKEAVLAEKEKSFIPNAMEELKGLLSLNLEKTEHRIHVLENNDRDQLLTQKNKTEGQINTIRADILSVFGELKTTLETEKIEALRELRMASQDYMKVKDRSGTKTVQHSYRVSDSKWYNPFSWFKSHVEYYTTEENYTYCLAADVIENVRNYGLESTNQVEQVFVDAIKIKSVKRNLMKMIADDFDTGNEKFDASFYRILVEDTVNQIQFPVFKINIIDEMNTITNRFNGEITGANEKTQLEDALLKAITRILDELSGKLETEVRKFKDELVAMEKSVEKSLLQNITKEFEELLAQCDNKDKEINGYKEYTAILKKEIAGIKA